MMTVNLVNIPGLICNPYHLLWELVLTELWNHEQFGVPFYEHMKKLLRRKLTTTKLFRQIILLGIGKRIFSHVQKVQL